MKFLTPLLTLLLASAALAQEPAELSERRLLWEEQREQEQEKIDNLYFTELDQLKENFTKAGNIAAAIAVNNEIEGEEKGEQEPALLTKLRDTRNKSFHKAVKPIDKKYWIDLKKLKSNFQQQGSLKAVLETDAEIEKVLAAYKKPEAPKKKAEDAKEEPKEKQDDDPKEDNNPKAAAILEQAKGKDAQFQYDLAQRYFEGDGVEKDEKTAIKLMHMSADQNNGAASANLSLRYARGHGVSRDKKRAAELAEKAIASGYREAGWLHAIAKHYFKGDGLPKDDAKGIEFLSKSSELGHWPATRDLGNLYLNGGPVTKDKEKAVSIFRQGANQGHRYLQHRIGCLYRDGDGVPKDKEKAAEWFRLAADQGLKAAEMDLELLK
jgi:TPR repeat protein